MRSKRPPTLEVHCIVRSYDSGASTHPTYVQLGQRHFEKELPSPKRGWEGASGEDHYLIPLDLLRVARVPSILVDAIEEVEVVYKKKK